MNETPSIKPASTSMNARPAPSVVFLGLETYGAHGGIQRFNRRVVATLDALGVPTFALMKADAAQEVPPDTDTMRFVGAGGNAKVLISAFLAAVRHGEVLLLGHINLLPFAALFRILKPRGKVVLFAHGVEVWGDPAYRTPRWWEGRALRAVVDRIAIVSAYSRDRMSKTFGVGLDRFCLFPNTVSIASRPKPASDAGHGNTILCVCRLGVNEREKHVAELIRAMQIVRETVSDAALLIVGDGPLRPELEALSAELGLGEAVRFAGFVSDEALARAYEDAALFALPSSKEGFGIVYLEAWLRGLAVVGSQFGAGAEVIADGVDGRTVDPQDIAALAQAIVDLLRDLAARARMAEAGWDKVSTRYSDAVLQRNLSTLLGIPG